MYYFISVYAPISLKLTIACERTYLCSSLRVFLVGLIENYFYVEHNYRLLLF